MGSPWALALALLVCLGWLLSGPLCSYSDTWQLTINTGTTVVTFLAVFLIQRTQNRDTMATQLKRLRADFQRLAERAGRPVARSERDR